MIDFKKEIKETLDLNIEGIDIEKLIEIPPDSNMGDYALPCFRFSKEFRKSPNIIAEEISEKFKDNKYFEKVENTGGYVNFFMNKSMLLESVLKEIFLKGEDYGKQNIGNGKNIVIDYSSPNIAKPFHVGHLRSTVIGNSLYKIYNHLGYNSVGINHLGDWGTQFGKMICAYKKWGNDEEIKENPIESLQKLYVKFHDESEKDDKLEDEGRLWFKKLEQGDKESRRIWEWFVELSLEEFRRIYKILNVDFDYYTGESFYEDKMDRTVELIKEKNILVDSEGALIVDLEEYNMPPCLIVKKDGTTIYATRDISAAIYRKETFDFEKAIYVTDYAQNLHFKQWFKVIELMGYEWADKLYHTPFGRVSTEEGKLQSRKGNVILLEDLLSKSIEKVKEHIQEKNPELENKDKVAEQIGIGAIIYNDLSNGKIKDIVFNWDRMLSFEGETGPYLQYTYARCRGIIGKSNIDITENVDFNQITDEVTIELVKELHNFPNVIINAMEKNEPSFISRSIMDIAQSFNHFYHENQILNSEEEVKKARLLVVYGTSKVLKLGLNLLGIETPEKM